MPNGGSASSTGLTSVILATKLMHVNVYLYDVNVYVLKRGEDLVIDSRCC